MLIVAGVIIFFTQKYYQPKAYAEMRVTEIELAGETINARMAETPADQERGLMGVASLDDDEGMIFTFPKPINTKFWNKGMLMPFDLVWVANGRVLGIERNIPLPADVPKIYESPAHVNGVIELSAGWADRHGVRVGDLISGL